MDVNFRKVKESRIVYETITRYTSSSRASMRKEFNANDTMSRSVLYMVVAMEETRAVR